jgi:hypothetical protein
MPSGLRRSPVVEADGRAPMERQAVAKIAREVPPDTDARLAEEPVEDRRQRVELIREPGDPLLQLARRHVAWSKDRVDLAVVAVPIRRQQASGTDVSSKNGVPGIGTTMPTVALSMPIPR